MAITKGEREQVLVRMWGEETVPVGGTEMQILGENHLRKTDMTQQPTSGCMFKGNEVSKQPHAHCNVIYNAQDIESA